jgi:hypothetical protein
VISETDFAQRYTSIWHQVLPMADVIARRLNVSYRQFARPLTSTANPRRRAYINELGFRIFTSSMIDGLPRSPDPSIELVEQLEESTAFLISRLRSRDEMPRPDPTEREEALSLSRRLFTFFNQFEHGALLRAAPEFAGCGIVNTCFGDLLSEPTLFEVKAGARDFRAVDVRQIITYCALNFAARRYDIKRAALINPRQGIFAEIDVHADLERASGVTASEVYAQLLDFMSQDLSQGDVARARER